MSATSTLRKLMAHEYSCRNLLPAHNPCQPIQRQNSLAINHKSSSSFHVSKLQFSAIAPTLGFATRAVNCEIMLMHEPKTSSGFTSQVIQQRIYDHAADTASLLDIRPIVVACTHSALWTGSCCQVYPYPSQYHPEPSSHQVCETPH